MDKIPIFRNTHDAIVFVKKYYKEPGLLKALKKKRDKLEKECDYFMEHWRYMAKIRNNTTASKLMKITSSAQAHREAVEIMEKKPHWKFVWGKFN